MSKSNLLNSILKVDNYKDGILYRKCPKCGEIKPLIEFGLRKMGNGKVREQSWCKKCR